MAGGPAVGAATLTRFYALHVVLLPILTLALIGLHLLLLRKHGHAGPMAEPDPREPFFPYQAARDGAVILAVILVLFWLAVRHPAPLERLADPTDTMSVPRPEWYFLPLFQLLKSSRARSSRSAPRSSGLSISFSRWSHGSTRRWRRLGTAGRSSSWAAPARSSLGLLILGARDAPRSRPPGPAPLGRAADPRLLGGLASYESAAARRATGRRPAGGSAARNAVGLAARAYALQGGGLIAHVKEKSAKPAEAEEDGENPEEDVPPLLPYLNAVSKERRGSPRSASRSASAARRSTAKTAGSATSSTGRAAGAGPCCSTCSASGQGLARRALRGSEEARPGSKMPPFKVLPDAELRRCRNLLPLQ